MSKKKFDIKLFQEFTLQSCFNESFLPAFTYFKGNDLYYLMNNLVKFRFVDGEFQVRGESFESRNIMEKKFGIRSEILYEKQDNVLEFIQNQLNENKMVICRTLNSWAYDENTKKKTEVSNGIYHWNLIFGYDSNERVFDVVEHYTNAAALYYPLKMKYEILEKSYSDSFQSPHYKDSMYIIWKDEDVQAIQDKECFLTMFERQRNDLETSTSSIIAYIKYVVVKQNKNITYKDVMQLSEVVKYIRVINYIVGLFQKDNDLGIEVINQMNLLRTYYIKWLHQSIDKNWEGVVKYTQLVTNTLEVFMKCFDQTLVQENEGEKKI